MSAGGLYSREQLIALTDRADLENVERLSLDNDPHDTSLAYLGDHLPNLAQLSMSQCHVSNIRCFGSSLARLTSLRLVRCRVESLDGLVHMAQLEDLFVPFNLIADIWAIAGMAALEVIDLEGNLLATEEDLAPLSLVPRIANICLRDNPVCTSRTRARIASHLRAVCPTATDVDVGSDGEEDDQLLLHLDDDSDDHAPHDHSDDDGGAGSSTMMPRRLRLDRTTMGNDGESDDDAIPTPARAGRSLLRERFARPHTAMIPRSATLRSDEDLAGDEPLSLRTARPQTSRPRACVAAESDRVLRALQHGADHADVSCRTIQRREGGGAAPPPTPPGDADPVITDPLLMAYAAGGAMTGGCPEVAGEMHADAPFLGCGEYGNPNALSPVEWLRMRASGALPRRGQRVTHSATTSDQMTSSRSSEDGRVTRPSTHPSSSVSGLGPAPPSPSPSLPSSASPSAFSPSTWVPSALGPASPSAPPRPGGGAINTPPSATGRQRRRFAAAQRLDAVAGAALPPSPRA